MTKIEKIKTILNENGKLTDEGIALFKTLSAKDKDVITEYAVSLQEQRDNTELESAWTKMKTPF